MKNKLLLFPKSITKIVCIFFVLFSCLAHGQPFQFRHWQGKMPRVIVGSDTLQEPWGGGLNAPQFSRVHLDNDATEDLLVFDRASQKSYTYLARGANFIYAPEYEYKIPISFYWILARDYNCDGRKDLWVGLSGSVHLYKNQIDWQGNTFFVPVVMPLMSTSLSGDPLVLSVDANDIPAIDDIDNDGDMDLICFAFGGGMIEFHKNMAIESGLGCGVLPKMAKFGCWGGILEGSVCGSYSFGLACRLASDSLVATAASPMASMHAGSALLTLPLNADNRPDLLIGHVGCGGLYAFTNTGSLQSAIFNGFSSGFPAGGPAVNFHTFPAAFYQDIDMDGKNELLAAPNLFNNEGEMTDFKNSAWLYKNTAPIGGNPLFVLQKKNFLQENMIDLGENAAPCFADIDLDNDMDMVVGHRGTVRPNGQFAASLYFYRNIGSRTNPIFSLEDTNFLSLASQNIRYIRPVSTDFDQDGRTDLLVSTTANNGQTGQICLFYHQNIPQQPYNLGQILNIPAGGYDCPAAIDINQDGRTDILLGKTFGSLYYYQNTGTNQNPNFILQNPAFLGITNPGFAFYLSICIADINADGQPDLLRTDARGQLRIHSGFLAANPPAADTLLLGHTLSGQMMATRFGEFSTIGVANLDADSLPDLAVGLGSGGLILLKNHQGQPLHIKKPAAPKLFVYYPNPASDYVNIESSEAGSLRMYDVLGRMVLKVDIKKGGNNVGLNGYKGGLYRLDFQNKLENYYVGNLKIIK